ncbi:DNA-binding MarR family transcriptional regulator [Pseudomonas sp. SLBN-26]|uniref:MarR family winged helix-turn-helix transcriptional regulator n=1 Tax=Pseudomonadaceae TaxID=135621 RepID=UPI00114F6114|nr:MULTISPECIES: MarR family transcriptional regulator [Pseudomonas]MCP1616028.1 DNA-binding MarR family transcriptional regulator [Pseudomonas otitidis]TQL05294.1 DNA-binding MarR family transcriptional regulator [Pseudomonas sp. SLBN-26]
MKPLPSPPEADLLLENQLCFKLYAASRLVIRGYRPLLERLRLTYPQYLAMLVLWEWQARPPEQPTVKALGERLMLDSGTLTPLLKRLEQLGHVQRRRAAQDEREVHLALTPSGVALRDETAALRAQLICDSGLELDEMVELRARLSGLLERFSGLAG